MTPPNGNSHDDPNDHNETFASRRFRFKRRHDDIDGDKERESRRRRHRSHHRRKRARSAGKDNDQSADHNSTSRLPPDIAFQESLFDALGDDEGADFWQGVYGQPIHNYSNAVRNEETGELERMSDEEYASFVRRKMWEKSREGIEAAQEEKRRQQKAREQRRERERFGDIPQRARSPDFLFDLDIDSSLRRGAQRKDRKKWKTLWKDYVRCWEELQTLHEAWKVDQTMTEQLFLRNKIAWPVESGKRKDVNNEEIERFIRKCAESNTETSDGSDLTQVLKTQRIQFHPDKIQQRYGFMKIDDMTMQGVTAVFQVLDRMWNELRNEQD